MSKLSEFIDRGRSGISSVTEKLPNLPHLRKGAPPPDDEPLDEESFAAITARIGEQNEGLRSLLVEASRKIEELETLRETFDGIVDPISKILRELEYEKSHNVDLRNLLSETRSNYDKLRTDHVHGEKKRITAESEVERLRDDLDHAQQNLRALETSSAELSSELNSKRIDIVDLERQLASETAQRQSLAEDNTSFSEQVTASDKKIIQIEAELQSVRANLLLSEDEKGSIQKSLEQNVGEVARLSRRLTETESLLAAARTKIDHIEAALADAEAERKTLESRLEEEIERHQTENNTLATRLELLQSRAATAERLLADARQNLAARTEEVRDFDRKAMEATIAKNTAEKKARQIESSQDAVQRQIAELTQSRATLVERSGQMSKTLKTREAALARAEAKIAALSERIEALETELETTRSADEKRLDELNSALNRERVERAVTEGALEGSRKDFARVQRELSVRSALQQQRTKGSRTLAPVNAAAIAKAEVPLEAEVLPPVAAVATPSLDSPKGKNGKRPPSSPEPVVKN